jgi:hypothetical protein
LFAQSGVVKAAVPHVADPDEARVHVALPSPVRTRCDATGTDGMNLVAKEYIAAQGPDNPGDLILSRFAGAAAECTAALLVNPYDPEAVATRSRTRSRCRLRELRRQKLIVNGSAHAQDQADLRRITSLAPLGELITDRSAVDLPLPGLGTGAMALIEFYGDSIVQAESEEDE